MIDRGQDSANHTDYDWLFTITLTAGFCLL